MRKFDIYIDNQRLDLFDDETVTLNSSVQNINDISKIFTDFTPQITFPATKRNNLIFKRFYDADITNGFDPRARVPSRIEIGTMPFRSGFMRMIGATIKDGKVQDYKGVFIGNLANLTQLFGEDELSALNLSAYDFTFNSANVLTGLQTGLFSETIVFPLFSFVKRLIYDSTSTVHTNDDKNVNIAYHAGHTGTAIHGINFNSLKPAIRVAELISAIQTKYGITFTGDGFTQDAVSKLYLLLSKEKGEISNIFDGNVTQQITNFDTAVVNFGLGSTQGTWFATEDPGFDFYFIDVNVTSSDGLEYRIEIHENDVMIDSRMGTGNLAWQFTGITRSQLLGSTYKLKIVSKASKVLDTADFGLFASQGNTIFDYSKTTNFVVLSSIWLNVALATPKLKVKDFIDGLIKMFNLAIVPTDSTTFFMRELDKWYDDGNVIDITKYVDVSQIDVERGKLLNTISFEHKEGGTILYKKFEELFKRKFGDSKLLIKDAQGELIDGTSLDIKVPFEQVIYERLTDAGNGTQTNIHYGYIVDEKQDVYKLNPHLFYVQKKSVTATPISFVDETPSQQQVTGNVFMPFQTLNTSLKNESSIFNTEIDSWDGTLIENSLFNLNYKDYIARIFDSRRRVYKVKAQLPLRIVTTLQLNDTLVINGRLFTINTMNVNLSTGEVEFELINKL